MRKLVALSLALMMIPVVAAAADRAYLGVRVQTLDEALAAALDLEEDAGVLIRQVEADSPAEEAGLKAGDIVTAINGDGVSRPSELTRMVREFDPGSKVTLDLLRQGKAKELQVALGEAERQLARSERRLERRFPGGVDVRELRLDRERGFLGVSPLSMSDGLAEYFDADNGGALVSDVVEDSPADELGLRAGDVITAINGKSVEDADELRERLGDFDEAEEVEVTWLRKGREQSGKVEIEMREMTFGNIESSILDRMPRLRWFGGDDGEQKEVLIERLLDGEESESLREEMEALKAELEELKESLQNN